MVNIWSSPNDKPLPCIRESECIAPSVLAALDIDEANLNPEFTAKLCTSFVPPMVPDLGSRLAKCVKDLPGDLYISFKTLEYDVKGRNTTFFVHGIKEKPEFALSFILESVRGISTCSIHSLEKAKGAWKGRYALRFSSSITYIKDFLD